MPNKNLSILKNLNFKTILLIIIINVSIFILAKDKLDYIFYLVFFVLSFLSYYLGLETKKSQCKELINKKDNINLDITLLNLRLRALIENIEAGILVEDENGDIFLVNKILCSFFNKDNIQCDYSTKKRCDCINKFCEQLFYYPNKVKKELQAISEKKNKILNTEIVLVDGRVLNVDFIPIPTAGNLWIYRDITKDKINQNILITSNKKAQEANREKTNFLNIVTHELKTPLTVILGNLNYLNKVYKDSEAIKDSINAGNHLHSLINDLLDISQIEAGKMEIFCDTISNSTINDWILEFKDIIEEKNHQLEIIFKNKTPVYADPKRLKQILNNLISNSIKFTEEGTISIEIEEIDKKHIISVSDTGLGISELDKQKIFTKFFQTDYRYSGSGLGLNITKKLVKLHNGNIYFKSKFGEYTTFYIELPNNFS